MFGFRSIFSTLKHSRFWQRTQNRTASSCHHSIQKRNNTSPDHVKLRKIYRTSYVCGSKLIFQVTPDSSPCFHFSGRAILGFPYLGTVSSAHAHSVLVMVRGSAFHGQANQANTTTKTTCISPRDLSLRRECGNSRGGLRQGVAKDVVQPPPTTSLASQQSAGTVYGS